jgi:hypothetical protein
MYGQEAGQCVVGTAVKFLIGNRVEVYSSWLGRTFLFGPRARNIHNVVDALPWAAKTSAFLSASP